MLEKPYLEKQVFDAVKGKVKNIPTSKDNFTSTQGSISDKMIENG